MTFSLRGLQSKVTITRLVASKHTIWIQFATELRAESQLKMKGGVSPLSPPGGLIVTSLRLPFVIRRKPGAEGEEQAGPLSLVEAVDEDKGDLYYILSVHGSHP